MLPRIRGVTLPNPTWSAFSFDRVLQYYDGPRLLLQQSRAGQIFLAWWSDSDELVERWVYLPVSQHRLREILSGAMPSLEGLYSPEDGCLFVIDKDPHTDSIIQAVMTAATELPSDALPRSGARINIPVPAEFIDTPSREGAHILSVKLEGKPSDVTGRISAKVASQLTGNLQRLVDALGQAKSGYPTARGSIPETILNETRLDPVSINLGSLVIRLETSNRDDLFGESLAKSSLEGLFDLFEVGYEIAELASQLSELKSRVAKNYKDFLSTIESSLNAASLTWNQSGKPMYRQFFLNDASARSIIAQIDAATDLTQDNIALEVTLIGANVRTLRFEVATLDTSERFEGFIHEEVISEIEKITLNSECRVILQPNLQVSEVSGEERTTYILLEIRPV